MVEDFIAVNEFLVLIKMERAIVIQRDDAVSIFLHLWPRHQQMSVSHAHIRNSKFIIQIHLSSQATVGNQAG